MYNRDVPRIIKYVEQKGPDGLVDVGSFILATIQTPLSRTKDLVADIKKNKADSKALWGHKRKGYVYLEQHKDDYYQVLLDSGDKTGYDSVCSTLEEVMKTPCMGMAKASFFMQCLGWETGCLDVHNLREFGLDRSFTIADKKGKKLASYVSFVQHKGSEPLWNDWCTAVAGNRMNKSLTSGDVVSDFHYQAISVGDIA